MPGVGEGAPGRRSRARNRTGGHLGDGGLGRGHGVHVFGTLLAAAGRQRHPGRPRPQPDDVRRAIREGREGNLVIFVVDASGSMAARDRMSAVSGATLSLLRDAYQRRDKVAVITFRQRDAHLLLPPTSSVHIASRRLARFDTGGKTPLAQGLLAARDVVVREKARDRARRSLVVVLTDGRATGGPDPLGRARTAAALLVAEGAAAVVVDCETSHVRLGLAEQLAGYLGAPAVRLAQLRADALTDVVRLPRKETRMPQGQPLTVPDDGLTTRARRNAPLLAVHTGAGKGKSTAAFGMALRAWNQGFNVAVFQFVKSAKWKVGEEAAFRELGRLHEAHGVGGPVEWHKMGAGWSWSRKHGDRGRPCRGRRRRLGGDQPAACRAAARFLRPRRVHLSAEMGLGRRRRGGRDLGGAAGHPARRDHRPRCAATAARRRGSRDRDDEGQTPHGRGPQGPEGHRVVTLDPRATAKSQHYGASAYKHGRPLLACGPTRRLG